jgi:hypothetical protein
MIETIETLTERDLAAMLRCTASALRRMRREGRGPRWTRVGRLVRYPRPWVQDWIEGNEGTIHEPGVHGSQTRQEVEQ